MGGFCVAPQRAAPAQPSTKFLKPSSDDEDPAPKKSSNQAWKKSSIFAHELDRSENVSQDSQRTSEPTVTAPQEAAPSRFETFHFVACV